MWLQTLQTLESSYSCTNLEVTNKLDICKGASYSYVSYGNCYHSLIDHILLPVETLCYLSYCEIIDDNSLNVSRHRPIVASFCIPLVEGDCVNRLRTIPDESKINWRREQRDSNHF